VLAVSSGRREGRYQPDPACPPAASLRAWLRGIAWRQSSHYRERAYQRHETPFATPQRLLRDQAGADPHEQLIARDALRAIAVLPKRYLSVLSAIARGQSIAEYAREHGMEQQNAWSRLRFARDAFREYLAGRRWRRP
jgi:RNA polymerase sigma-70 factor, ECF subfamily